MNWKEFLHLQVKVFIGFFDMLSKIISEKQDDWDTWPPSVTPAHRTPTQSSTGITPHRTMLGREARLPVDLVSGSAPEVERYDNETNYVIEAGEKLRKAHDLARNNMKRVTKRYKDYYDSKADGGKIHKVGDRVWLHVPYVKQKRSLKLSRPWHGPFVVVKCLSDVVTRIQ